MRSKNAPSQKTAGSALLQMKILMATSIMLKEMEPPKKEAILNLLQGRPGIRQANMGQIF